MKASYCTAEGDSNLAAMHAPMIESCTAMPHPMNINRTIAAVMSAPLLAGESIPNMANTMMMRHMQSVCMPDPRQATSRVGWEGGRNTSP